MARKLPRPLVRFRETQTAPVDNPKATNINLGRHVRETLTSLTRSREPWLARGQLQSYRRSYGYGRSIVRRAIMCLVSDRIEIVAGQSNFARVASDLDGARVSFAAKSSDRIVRWRSAIRAIVEQRRARRAEKEQGRSARYKFARLFRPEERLVQRLCGIRNTIYLFVIRACTRGAPKSNNDLNRPRAGDVRFRVISVARTRARPLAPARARARARYRARNFINTLKILRHRRASRVEIACRSPPGASSAPPAK